MSLGDSGNTEPMEVGVAHLRAVTAVAEHGSIRGAATHLSSSERTLIRYLDELESILGVALLLRHARPITLTTAGREFLPHARATLDSLGDESATPLVTIATRVGYGWLLPQPWAAQVAEHVHDTTGAVVAFLRCADPLEALRRGDVDWAVLRTCHHLRSVRLLPMFDEPLVALCARLGDLAAREQLDWTEVRNWPLMIHSRGDINETGRWRRDHVPRTIVDTPTFEHWIATLARGQGISVVPASVDPALLHPQLRALSLRNAPTAPVYLAHLRTGRRTARTEFLAAAGSARM